MLKKIVLCSVLIAGGFWLGYSRASTSIDKEVRKEILKEKELESLYYQVEALRKGNKILREELIEMTDQSVRNESKAIEKRMEIQSTLMEIANDLNSYSPVELKAKLVCLSLELGQ